jgi:hypothetical protein
VGPRASMDTQARGKILSPLPGIEHQSPGRPARSQTLYCLRYPAHELAKYKLDLVLVGLQEVRCDKGGTVPLFMETGMRIIYYGRAFSYTREP